ncbi:MAG TPA: S1 RNA-binding domain-containing protein, partial [Acidimicrobiia bacterium]
MPTDTEAAPSMPAPETNGTEPVTESTTQAPDAASESTTEQAEPKATPSEPDPNAPAPSEPDPNAPAPSEVDPSDADPVDPAPRDSAPSDPAPSDPAPSVEMPSEMDDFEAAINQTVVGFREGDIVEGRVVSVDADGAMVDVGYKSEGLIPTEELSIRANIDPSSIVSVGDKVEALVLNKEDDEGRLILSKKRAQYERAWGRV